uniref:Regulatory protein zeste n=1 Tax=Bombyx mori TaxID=7091 RepID=A0A8R2MAS7_BOMMO|nr:uncharacterized protein LOC119631232 isoform X5 [Bombyx mori]
MRTSHSQYLTMVEFMEANGDLSKPSGGPRGRNFIQMKWKELTGLLNSDSSGDPKSEDKWRKEEISTEMPNTQIILKEPEIDWNAPSTSSQPTVAPPPPTEAPPPVINEEEEWNPPPQKKRKNNLTKIFLDIDRKAREHASERDRVYEELERDRLRVREFEVRERVRQRDEELRMQGQWLEFMKEAMEAFVRFMERKS